MSFIRYTISSVGVYTIPWLNLINALSVYQLNETMKIDTQHNIHVVFTQGPNGRASGANGNGAGSGNGAGNLGTTNANNGPNGMDKTRTTQTNSGDMLSSNQGWNPYRNSNDKSTTNLGDIAVLSACVMFILLLAL